MSLTACVLCHHEELRPRWVGDLLMTYCDRCGCLYVPDSAAPLAGSCPPWAGQRSSGHADPATRTAALPLAVTKASPAH